MSSSWNYKPEGEGIEYKGYFYKTHKNGTEDKISPFHEINLWYTEPTQNIAVANMIVEIPKGTTAKMEIKKEEDFNPIKQDLRNGKLRVVSTPYPFNYGALPQTWENPNYHNIELQTSGDNDLMDAVEISGEPLSIGSVKQVKILGALALIDEGQTDWKILCIDMNNPLAAKLSEAEDMEIVVPGLLKMIVDFFRDYKLSEGKGQNKFGFGARPRDRYYAVDILQESHQQWRSLFSGFVQQQQNINFTVSNPSTKRMITLEKYLTGLTKHSLVDILVEFMKNDPIAQDSVKELVKKEGQRPATHYPMMPPHTPNKRTSVPLPEKANNSPTKQSSSSSSTSKTSATSPKPRLSVGRVDITEELFKLKYLLDCGALTKEEFDFAKKKVLTS